MNKKLSIIFSFPSVVVVTCWPTLSNYRQPLNNETWLYRFDFGIPFGYGPSMPRNSSMPAIAAFLFPLTHLPATMPPLVFVGCFSNALAVTPEHLLHSVRLLWISCGQLAHGLAII
jgi:hypothetical protein